MKKLIAASFSLLLLVGCDNSPTPVSLSDIHLLRYSSCDDIDQTRTFDPDSYWGVSRDADVLASGQEDSFGGTANASPGETNVQVSGVDEIDTSKAEGDFIYHVKQGSGGIDLMVLRRYPIAQAGIIQTLAIADEYSGALFVTQERVALVTGIGFSSGFSPGWVVPPDGTTGQELPEYSFPTPTTEIYIYLRGQNGTLSLENRMKLDGSLTAGRLIGNQLHMAMNRYIGYRYANHHQDSPPVADLLPAREFNSGTLELCSCEEILYEPALRARQRHGSPFIDNLLGVVSLDLTDPAQSISSEWVAGVSGSTIYASPENMFIASYGWSSQLPIHQFRLAKDGRPTEYVGSGLVNGHLLNQFSLDEYDGHLRVAVTEQDARRLEGSEPANRVSILQITGKDLPTVGRTRALAPGERIYAVRFMQSRGFVVTFRQVDPLFALDLTNPEDPQVKGVLKVPGFSNYLHPFDENHLIGLGQEADEQGRVQGLALSLFDVRDLNQPTLLHKEVLGGRGSHSEAERDHKAFRLVQNPDYIAIPVEIMQDWSSQFEGFRFFGVSVQSGFQLLGESAFPSSSHSYGGNRSFADAGVLSLLGGDELVLRDLVDPSQELARIALP